MSRIPQDALRSLHGLHSSDPHPLLADRDSATNNAPLSRPSRSKPGRSDSPVEGDIDRLDESLGTLTIDPQSGKSSFFGQSAGMEVCLALVSAHDNMSHFSK